MMRRGFDLALYLVTEPGIADTLLLERVARAVDAGVTMVQLRHKGHGHAATVLLGRALQALVEPRGVPLIVNDDVQAARLCGAAGVHLGQSDMPPAEARRLLGDWAVIGLSLERVQDVATVDPGIVDYVAASPVFATATKTDTAPPLGLAGVSAIRRALALPLVGIGGITPANVASVIEAGADGVAVVSAILAADDPRPATRALRREVSEALARRATPG